MHRFIMVALFDQLGKDTMRTGIPCSLLKIVAASTHRETSEPLAQITSYGAVGGTDLLSRRANQMRQVLTRQA